LLKDFSKFQKNSRRRSKEIEKDRETQRRENRTIKTNKAQKRKDTEPFCMAVRHALIRNVNNYPRDVGNECCRRRRVVRYSTLLTESNLTTTRR